MTPEPIDSVQFKRDQQVAWSSVASAWRKYWSVLEAGLQPLNERLVELSALGPGDRALDVGTGIGEPALTAARRVGRNGSVLATDFSPAMLELGRERARKDRFSWVEFLERDAEALDLPPDSFDGAVSRFMLMLLLDPGIALEGIHSALRPGGRFATAVWGPVETVPFLGVARNAALAALGLPPPPGDMPGPFRLGAEGALAGKLVRAGFDGVVDESFEVRLEFPTPEHYVDFSFELSSSLRKLLADRGDRERAVVRNAIARAAEEHIDGGRVQLRSKVWLAVGLSG